jgi:hypothetical protein
MGPLQEVASDSISVMESDLEFRHDEFTELLARLRGSSALDASECDTTKVFRRRGQFLRRDRAWQLNAPPEIPQGGSMTVKYEYDDSGRRSGASNEIDLPAPTDPDGDSVTVSWIGLSFNGDSLVPMTALRTDGLTASFRGTGGARVLAIARDRWGAADTAEFCFESQYFRC